MAQRRDGAGKTLRRPQPPSLVTEGGQFYPAPAVLGWISENILAEGGAIHNPDHKHLIGADIEVLWAPGSFRQKGRTVVGTAEDVNFRAGGWQKARQEQQFEQWFGRVPRFLITLDASYCRECSDTEWCALVEHELSHIAHKLDAYGVPAFDKAGRPKLCIQGHDVEQFVGVVARYGVGAPDSALARMVAAAKAGPTVSRVALAGSCGTCLLKAA